MRIRGRLGCGGLIGAGSIAVSESGIPALEQGPERAVEGARASLQQQVRSATRPLHLLSLGKTFADHGVHRGLDEGRRDSFAGPVSLAVVNEAAGIRGDVDAELVGSLGEFAHVRIVHVERVYFI